MVSNFKERNFWLAFFVTISVLAIATAVYFGVSGQAKLDKIKSNVIKDDNVYKRRVENGYRQTLYTIEDSLKNMDADLGKTALSNDSAMQTERLLNVVCQANNLSASVAHLPLSASENLDKIETFANQTGDYAVSLIKRLQQGDKLTAKDKATLVSLDATCSGLYCSIKEFVDKQQSAMLVDKLFVDGSGALGSFVDTIDSKVFEYEKLIYDGPYSDAAKQAVLPCKQAISTSKGKEIVAKQLGATQVDFVGQINDNGVTYVYDIKTPNGSGRVTLACDGRLAEYEFVPNQPCKYNIDSKQAIAVAQKFCKANGFDVEAIWVSALSDDVIYVNLAPIVNNAIIYSDLVKVAVSCNGLVVGAETRAYLTNHQNHQVDFGKVTSQQAEKGVDGIKVVNVRKAIVNKQGTEYACWEIEGTFCDNQYFVYIDSNTGKEVEIFKVIEGTEGHTV
ncbi:MAG: germination protein YpeB, partial [Clostridia bacterium]|nr:germination protein YpeB [Clostridia bacterium]